MWLVNLALRRPYTVWVGMLLILVLGVLSYTRTPTDILPNIKAPVVVAVTDPVALRKMIAVVYGNLTTSVGDTPAAPASEPVAAVAFTCPGCQQQLTLRAAPWVMTELNRDPGRYYVWEREPGDAKPAHVCGRT